MVNYILFTPYVDRETLRRETIRVRGKQTRFHAAIVAAAARSRFLKNRSVGFLAVVEDETLDLIDTPAIVPARRVPDPDA